MKTLQKANNYPFYTLANNHFSFKSAFRKNVVYIHKWVLLFNNIGLDFELCRLYEVLESIYHVMVPKMHLTVGVSHHSWPWSIFLQDSALALHSTKTYLPPTPLFQLVMSMVYVIENLLVWTNANRHACNAIYTIIGNPLL